MKSPNPSMPPEFPARRTDIPGVPRRRTADEDGPASAAAAPSAPAAAPAGGREGADRQLIVGRDISLAGEITACDHLIVEGRIEATLRDCRIIQVADGGTFKGSAEIEEAEIGGNFDGDLSVRGRLKVSGSGRISGNIRYGELEVAVGGRLTGTIEPLSGDTQAEAPGPAATVARPPFAGGVSAAAVPADSEAGSEGPPE
jgi:cytoskeletal protein CcmA (bactofilin family)